jgi:hypothetical protein
VSTLVLSRWTSSRARHQGGVALYFRSGRSDLTRYLEEVPVWARKVVESMAE